jgi:hypothetical protein
MKHMNRAEEEHLFSTVEETDALKKIVLVQQPDFFNASDSSTVPRKSGVFLELCSCASFFMIR